MAGPAKARQIRWSQPAIVLPTSSGLSSCTKWASTIGRRTAAIRYAHKFAGLPTPTDDELVKATVRGIRRILGTAKIKKAPATAERLLAMAANTGAGLKGLRDRSELVALNIEDIEEAPDGMKITIRHPEYDARTAVVASAS